MHQAKDKHSLRVKNIYASNNAKELADNIHLLLQEQQQNTKIKGLSHEGGALVSKSLF